MIFLRAANSRGHSNYEWLNSFHTFSFANYYDPNYTGFGHLLVINEDTVQPGMGFGMHGHHDMEIISYVVEGELAHKDSMGTGSVIKPGEIQKMSAGSGVKHSEFNNSANQPLHFLQIWIVPNQKNIPPAYEQKSIPTDQTNQLILIGSPTGGEHAVKIQQNVKLYVGYLAQNTVIDYELATDRYAWVQVIKGEINLNGQVLTAGDGAAIKDETKLKLQSHAQSEILFFDFGV